MKYRKKPVVVEAMQFTDETKNMVFDFVRCNKIAGFDADGRPTLTISTLEGEMTASLGDYVIQGVQGEFYPCKPDIFESTYEPVGELEGSEPDFTAGGAKIQDPTPLVDPGSVSGATITRVEDPH